MKIILKEGFKLETSIFSIDDFYKTLKERKAMSIRVCDENAVFCEKRRKLVNKNISYNRKNSIKLGLTNTTKLI